MTLQKFIEDAKRLCEEAAEGPWHFESSVDLRRGIVLDSRWNTVIAPYQPDDLMGKTKHDKAANYKLSAASRTLLPKALEMLEIALRALEILEMMHGYQAEENTAATAKEIAESTSVIAKQAITKIASVLGEEGG